MQIQFLGATTPERQPPGVDLRLCSVEDLIQSGDLGEAVLSVWDPPWDYGQPVGDALSSDQYETQDLKAIVQNLINAYGVFPKDHRLALWITWPFLGLFWEEVVGRGKDWPWRFVTGGSWHKTGPGGVGYHWLGKSEPILVFKKGSPCATNWDDLKNAHTSQIGRPSEKPLDWMAGWLNRWTDPGDLVADFYAGMAPLGVSCSLMGRRYLGAEKSPDRYQTALGNLSRWREHERARWLVDLADKQKARDSKKKKRS